MHNINLQRLQQGDFANLLNELRKDDDRFFRVRCQFFASSCIAVAADCRLSSGRKRDHFVGSENMGMHGVSRSKMLGGHIAIERGARL